MKRVLFLLALLTAASAHADQLRPTFTSVWSNDKSPARVCDLDPATQKKHLAMAEYVGSGHNWKSQDPQSERYATSYDPKTRKISVSSVWSDCGSCNDGSNWFHGWTDPDSYTVRGNADCSQKFVDVVYYNFNGFRGNGDVYSGPDFDDQKFNIPEMEAMFGRELRAICSRLNVATSGASAFSTHRVQVPNGYYREHFYSAKKPKFLVRLEGRCVLSKF